ncbi:SDR family oxidoreductase [Tenacibaculum sp. TC6]|uniref:SDR family oxidoreductase n=1 Tax=Tenacibaculum sp. TC6 TaxID=3423223 RepID=UPI003D36A00A
MLKKQISIVGSGWLGLPLAEFLKSKGYLIKNSTTSENKIPLLTDKGLTPYIFSLGNSNDTSVIDEFIEGSEIVIIVLPPKRNASDIEQAYLEKIVQIADRVQHHQNVIFISSSSVYQNTNNWVTEETLACPEKSSGKAILAAEQLLQKGITNRLSIIRFAGLMGPNRHPGKFLATKKNLANGNAPINMIHLDDCIALINAVIEQNCWGEIINGCADDHPTREHFYTLAAQSINLPPPTFIPNEDSTSYKLISNLKSKSLLNYQYIHANPQNAL